MFLLGSRCIGLLSRADAEFRYKSVANDVTELGYLDIGYLNSHKCSLSMYSCARLEKTMLVEIT